ncbi:hypothetical protein ON010_g13895 [Phytophthora cinnamomi]|nr:hypothetical protein ON010_g13895 [Phytophthora cinnamomi]
MPTAPTLARSEAPPSGALPLSGISAAPHPSAGYRLWLLGIVPTVLSVARSGVSPSGLSPLSGSRTAPRTVTEPRSEHSFSTRSLFTNSETPTSSTWTASVPCSRQKRFCFLTEDEIVPRIQVQDQTAFHAIEIQKLHVQVHRDLGHRDTSARRKTNSDNATNTRYQRLSIQLTSFHRGAPGVVTRRSRIDQKRPWLLKALHSRPDDQQAWLAHTRTADSQVTGVTTDEASVGTARAIIRAEFPSKSTSAFQVIRSRRITLVSTSTKRGKVANLAVLVKSRLIHWSAFPALVIYVSGKQLKERKKEVTPTKGQQQAPERLQATRSELKTLDRDTQPDAERRFPRCFTPFARVTPRHSIVMKCCISGSLREQNLPADGYTRHQDTPGIVQGLVPPPEKVEKIAELHNNIRPYVPDEFQADIYSAPSHDDAKEAKQARRDHRAAMAAAAKANQDRRGKDHDEEDTSASKKATHMIEYSASDHG